MSASPEEELTYRGHTSYMCFAWDSLFTFSFTLACVCILWLSKLKHVYSSDLVAECQLHVCTVFTAYGSNVLDSTHPRHEDMLPVQAILQPVMES